jgi:hypothetical protein
LLILKLHFNILLIWSNSVSVKLSQLGAIWNGGKYNLVILEIVSWSIPGPRSPITCLTHFWHHCHHSYELQDTWYFYVIIFYLLYLCYLRVFIRLIIQLLKLILLSQALFGKKTRQNSLCFNVKTVLWYFNWFWNLPRTSDSAENWIIRSVWNF